MDLETLAANGRLAVLAAGRWIYLTRPIDFDVNQAAALRRGEKGCAVGSGDAEGHRFEVGCDEGLLVAFWGGATYRGLAADLAEALALQEEPRPVEPSASPPEKVELMCFALSPVEEYRALTVAEGVTLMIERRAGLVHFALDRPGESGHREHQRGPLDMRDLDRYTWLAPGCVAIKRASGDRAMVYQRGKVVGHVSIAKLREVILAMGGDLWE